MVHLTHPRAEKWSETLSAFSVGTLRALLGPRPLRGSTQAARRAGAQEAVTEEGLRRIHAFTAPWQGAAALKPRRSAPQPHKRAAHADSCGQFA